MNVNPSSNRQKKDQHSQFLNTILALEPLLFMNLFLTMLEMFRVVHTSLALLALVP